MALKFWTGSTSTAYGTAANWLANGVPADNDTLFYNDASTQGMAGGAQAGKTHAIIVDSKFAYGIGSSGTPFEPDDITSLMFFANSIVPSYFKSDTTDLDRVIVDTQSAKDGLVNLDGTIVDLTIRNGKVVTAATSTVNGRISLMGGSGGGSGELTVTAGTTVAGVEMSMNGGKCTCAASIPTVIQNGGEFILSASAGIGTYLEVHDGTFWWDAADVGSPSTIALAEILGGAFKTRTERQGRTLTNCNVYGAGIVDFSVGGHSMVMTNPVRAYGANPPRYPKSASYTIGV